MAGRWMQIVLLRFVESEGPAADIAMIRREIFDRRFLQKGPAIEGSSIQQHLLEYGQIVGVAEQSGMSCHAAKHRRSGIMNVTAQQLMPEGGLQRRRCD